MLNTGKVQTSAFKYLPDKLRWLLNSVLNRIVSLSPLICMLEGRMPWDAKGSISLHTIEFCQNQSTVLFSFFSISCFSFEFVLFVLLLCKMITTALLELIPLAVSMLPFFTTVLIWLLLWLILPEDSVHGAHGIPWQQKSLGHVLFWKKKVKNVLKNVFNYYRNSLQILWNT